MSIKWAWLRELSVWLLRKHSSIEFWRPLLSDLFIAQHDLFVAHLGNFLPDKADFPSKCPNSFLQHRFYFCIHLSRLFITQRSDCESVLLTYYVERTSCSWSSLFEQHQVLYVDSENVQSRKVRASVSKRVLISFICLKPFANRPENVGKVSWSSLSALLMVFQFNPNEIHFICGLILKN